MTVHTTNLDLFHHINNRVYGARQSTGNDNLIRDVIAAFVNDCQVELLHWGVKTIPLDGITLLLFIKKGSVTNVSCTLSEGTLLSGAITEIIEWNITDGLSGTVGIQLLNGRTLWAEAVDYYCMFSTYQDQLASSFNFMGFACAVSIVEEENLFTKMPHFLPLDAGDEAEPSVRSPMVYFCGIIESIKKMSSSVLKITGCVISVRWNADPVFPPINFFVYQENLESELYLGAKIQGSGWLQVSIKQND